MRHFATTIALLAFLMMASSAPAQAPLYGWTISASSTNGLVNTGVATGGVSTAYLWFHCSVGDGMAAAAMRLEASGPVVLATTAKGGFLNAGSTLDLLLAVGGCPTGPTVAANILLLALPGNICVGEHPNDGKVTVDCQPSPGAWPFSWSGIDYGGGPCGKGDATCQPVSVEDTSWGQVKGLYR